MSSSMPDRAISLTGPWWWLMLHLPEPWRKCVENRSPSFSGKNFRGPVWVHAAKGLTGAQYKAAVEFAFKAGVPLDLLAQMPKFSEMPRGGIVGRFTIIDRLTDPRIERACGVTRMIPDVERWRMPGCIGLVTEDANTVPFVPCKGALGIWRVPAPVLEELGKCWTKAQEIRQ